MVVQRFLTRVGNNITSRVMSRNMKPKIERCTIMIQWGKGINDAAYPGPKDF